MSEYLSCDAASALIEPMLDGELAIEAQVALQGHLRWCRVCEARADDLQLLRDSLRARHQATMADGRTAVMLATMRSSVLERVRAEREQSMPEKARRLFADRRLLWPAMGASAAVVVCACAASIVMGAVNELTRPDSLASMIEMLAHPGSERNPLWLDGRVSLPRALDPALVLDSVVEDDVAFAVSALVTREGRIANYELLLSERATGRRRESAAEQDVDAPAVMAAVRRSRFEPAKGADGPVAVNVVWLVTRTTVKPRVSAPVAAEPARRTPTPAVEPAAEKTAPAVDPQADQPLTDPAIPMVSLTTA